MKFFFAVNTQKNKKIKNEKKFGSFYSSKTFISPRLLPFQQFCLHMCVKEVKGGNSDEALKLSNSHFAKIAELKKKNKTVPLQ